MRGELRACGRGGGRVERRQVLSGGETTETIAGVVQVRAPDEYDREKK